MRNLMRRYLGVAFVVALAVASATFVARATAATKWASRVKESTTTTGTGTYSLGGSPSGFQTFVSGVGTGASVPYVVEMGANWEIGIGTVTDATPDTLSRDLIIASTNANAAVSWAAGTKTVFLDMPAAGGSLFLGTPPPSSCAFHLTTESGVPYSPADRTGQGTVYLTPVPGKGTAIWLYDTSGAAWFRRDTAEVSIALSSLTDAKVYDVFASWSGSAVALSLSSAWSSDTSRNDAVTTQDGITVLSSDKSKRLVGTIRTTGTNTTEDSAAKRFVWSTDHRRERHLHCKDTTDSWQWTTDSFQEARNQATYGTSRVGYVVGLDEDLVEATNVASCTNSLSAVNAAAGIGIDSASTNSAQMLGVNASNIAALQLTGYYRGRPGLGFHYLTRLERSAATGTTTWYGDGGSTWIQTGMLVTVPN